VTLCHKLLKLTRQGDRRTEQHVGAVDAVLPARVLGRIVADPADRRTNTIRSASPAPVPAHRARARRQLRHAQPGGAGGADSVANAGVGRHRLPAADAVDVDREAERRGRRSCAR
jgi:hypothetical protein